MDYAWLSARDALAIHEEQLAEHGGAGRVDEAAFAGWMRPRLKPQQS